MSSRKSAAGWPNTITRTGAAQALAADCSKLIEYNTPCVPGFVQSAARVALTECEADVSYLVAVVRANQQRLHPAQLEAGLDRFVSDQRAP